LACDDNWLWYATAMCLGDTVSSPVGSIPSHAAVNVNSVSPLVRGRREFDANSTSNLRRILRSQIFFHRRFSGELTPIMRRKFVEYLGTWLFSFLSNSWVTVVSASNTKRKPTKPSSNAQCTDYFIYLVCWWFIGSWQPRRSLGRSTTPIQHEQYLFVTNNTGAEYLAFLSQPGKMVSSEPSYLRKKWVPG
jgi:hypothetical protein